MRGPGNETQHSLEAKSRVASACLVRADGGEFLVTRGTRNLPSEDFSGTCAPLIKAHLPPAPVSLLP